jgi:hypothetical protein
MSLPDDMQTLWQQDNSEKENHAMWMQLVHEKRTGFDDLVQSENGGEYLGAIVMTPLLAFVAWKAKFPWVRVGYGVLAATFLVLAIVTWITQRPPSQRNDRSLLDHLKALLDSYDRRLRFLRNGKIWVTVSLSVGLLAVIMGIPRAATNAAAWGFVCVLLCALWGAQRWSLQRATRSILGKSEEAARLLRALPRD